MTTTGAENLGSHRLRLQQGTRPQANINAGLQEQP
jgi:hypothetical protein